jgi:hypothetical protein
MKTITTTIEEIDDTKNSISTIELIDKSNNNNDLYLKDILISSNKNSTNYAPSENELNDERLKYLEEKITPLFLSLIKYENFEFGQRCESIDLVEENIKINKVATQNWINKLYLRFFGSDEILLSLLRVINYLNKDLLYPTGQTIALSSLSHKNDEIKEMGVRIFESWGCIESYNILKTVKVGTIWLQEYVNEVIKDLEKDLWLC